MFLWGIPACWPATLLARHEPPLGMEALKGQRVIDLYRTPSGSYFEYETTVSLFVEHEDPEIIPGRPQEALTVYEEYDDQRLDFEEAFPKR